MKRILIGLTLAAAMLMAAPAWAQPKRGHHNGHGHAHGHAHAAKHKRGKHAKPAARRAAPKVYRQVTIRGGTYYERDDRYFRRVRHQRSGRYTYVETYPVGASYSTLPGRYERVVRRGHLMFRVGHTFFRPVYRNGVRTYVVVG